MPERIPWRRFQAYLTQWQADDDATDRRVRLARLFLVSLLSLFFELLVIRWLAAEIKIFAYLKNMVLLSSFLGLGVGFAMARRRVAAIPLFMPLALIITLSALLGSTTGLWTRIVIPGPDQIQLWGLDARFSPGYSLLWLAASWIPFYGVVVFFFLLNAGAFVPLGQYTGRCMLSFSPIAAYSVNLVGALAGTALFALVSFLQLPPLWWFGLVAAVTLALVARSRRDLLAQGLMGAALLLAVQILPEEAIWSPYHKLVLDPVPIEGRSEEEVLWGYQLQIGEYYYQEMLNLSSEFITQHGIQSRADRYLQYEVPYVFVRPSRVLVVGAGAGNDTATALRHGASQVDAVDIDPAILDFGRQLHPERPYQSPAVRTIVDDARSFFRKSSGQYDLIVYGLLDSQIFLSGLSGIRLDNFIYTLEAFREARQRLDDDGILAVAFQVNKPWIGERLYGLISQSFGAEPAVIRSPHGTVFLVGNDFSLSETEVAEAVDQLGLPASAIGGYGGDRSVPLTTDDWPFLYLKDRGIPFAYWTALALLAFLSVRFVLRAVPEARRIQLHFFFLGGAFLLLEFRIITELALLLGSTWIVNAAAISAVLVMAIAANIVVSRFQLSDVRPWAVALLLSMVATFLVPTELFLTVGWPLGAFIGASVLAFPVFFAGVVFAIFLRRSRSVEVAFASNLLGATMGGFGEYVSLVLGIGSLYLIGAGLYVLALITSRRS